MYTDVVLVLMSFPASFFVIVDIWCLSYAHIFKCHMQRSTMFSSVTAPQSNVLLCFNTTFLLFGFFVQEGLGNTAFGYASLILQTQVFVTGTYRGRSH